MGHKYSALSAVCAVVDLGSVVDVEDVNGARVLLDAVDDPVGSPTGSVAAGQWPEQRFAYPVRVDRQCGVAELQDRRGHRFREAVGDRALRGGLEPDLIPPGRFAVSGRWHGAGPDPGGRWPDQHRARHGPAKPGSLRYA